MPIPRDDGSPHHPSTEHAPPAMLTAATPCDFLTDLFGLVGRTAVVIGGTGVLGGAIADTLARAGATVVIVGRDAEAGATAVERIKKHGGAAEYYKADVTVKS